jgi:hypothetical protein
MIRRASTASAPKLIWTMVSVLVTCFIAGAAHGVPDGDALDQLLARMRQRQHGHVTFTERHISSILDRPLESSGELFYDAPDRLEKRTLQPQTERLVLEHGVLTIERRHREYRVALADYPEVAPYVDSIRATLGGDRPSLERAFHIEFSSSGGDWNLELSPLDARVAARVRRLRIQGVADDVHSVSVEFANGDQSIMTLANPAAP